jgi:hypothetical protein
LHFAVKNDGILLDISLLLLGEKNFMFSDGFPDALWRDCKRRLRRLQTPHAEMGNAARGNANRRSRRFGVWASACNRTGCGMLMRLSRNHLDWRIQKQLPP